MRILHTADWHLGKSFNGQSLIEDQAHILEQIMVVIREESVDVLILAGDIYDRTNPPEDAVSLYNEFVEKLFNETSTAFVAIAGNHDSGERIGTNETLLDSKRILIRGKLSHEERVLILEDEHGKVAFSALPYGEKFLAREVFDDLSITTPCDVLSAELLAAKLKVPSDARWIVVAHTFVSGGLIGDVEKDLNVGGIQTVPASIFENAHYVALGHLHRPQHIGSQNIRYSGAPLAFGFDEASQQKSMSLIDLGANGVENISLINFEPLRQVRVVKGLLAELIDFAGKNPNEDYVQAILTDEGGLIDPFGQLRKYYPNILSLVREKKTIIGVNHSGKASSNLDDPNAVIAEFVNFVQSEPINAAQKIITSSALTNHNEEK